MPRRILPCSLALASYLVLASACGEAAAPLPDRGEPPPRVPESVEEAWSWPIRDLSRAANELGNDAADHAGTAEGVALGRRAATFARVLSLRDPAGADWVARARAWLTEASRRRGLEGACEAALELARLEARDARDASAAYAIAYRTTLRFDGGQAGCVAEARRMIAILEPWRPPAAELSQIEADPNADDPSGASAPRPPQEQPTDAAERWARERAASGAAATLSSLSVYGHGGEGGETASVRVVLSFDQVVAFEHGEGAREGDTPRRTWLELASVRPGPDVAATLPVDAGGLSRVTTRAHESGMRVTFEIDERARFRAFVLPEPFRIVLDVEQGDERQAEGPVRLVVIDPGHGGNDYGARAFDMRESDLTLDLAQRVRTLLASRMPDVRVILTREEDVFLSLEQRAAIANSASADLFLSIHLNAADEPVQHGGVTTFVLDTSDDRQALRLAARENGTSVGEVGDLSRILASLHREDQLRGSRAFAELVHESTLRAGRRVIPRLYDRGVRSALFYVLVGARMPAVLLEASFLTREQEAEQLRTVRYRQALAEGIAEGIARWAGR
jgi:N-acetylmuramoyl-L-alanine amidase